MEVDFYCEDARDFFLEPESVDLFITHPPFLNKIPNAHGGDPSLQIQNADSIEGFADSLTKCVQSMEFSLKDKGAILLILPNTRAFFHIVKNIMDNTSLTINRDIVWNFEKSNFIKSVTGNEINHILYMTKNKDARHDVSRLESFVINEDWAFFYTGEHSFFDSLPDKLIDKLVTSFSEEGDTVGDFLAGTGSVTISSIKNNRKAIYNDVSPLQLELAKKRVYDTIKD